MSGQAWASAIGGAAAVVAIAAGVGVSVSANPQPGSDAGPRPDVSVRLDPEEKQFSTRYLCDLSAAQCDEAIRGERGGCPDGGPVTAADRFHCLKGRDSTQGAIRAWHCEWDDPANPDGGIPDKCVCALQMTQRQGRELLARTDFLASDSCASMSRRGQLPARLLNADGVPRMGFAGQAFDPPDAGPDGGP